MATPLYCLPTDILSYTATWSLPAGSINSAFPLANLNSVYSDIIARLTGNSGTFRGTIASTAIQGIVLVNLARSLAGTTATLTNGGAMASQSLVIPALPADRVSLNAAKDLRAVTAAATAWDTALTASSAIASARFSWFLSGGHFRQIGGQNRARSSRQLCSGRIQESPAALGKLCAIGKLILQFIRETFRAEYTTLRRSSQGPSQPFVIWLDPSDASSVYYCWFPNQEWESQMNEGQSTAWTDTVEEQNPGLGF